jgi:hypothetical protein
MELSLGLAQKFLEMLLGIFVLDVALKCFVEIVLD